jgi:hypothetical protein
MASKFEERYLCNEWESMLVAATCCMPRLVVGVVDLLSMLLEVSISLKVSNSLMLLQSMFRWNVLYNGC